MSVLKCKMCGGDLSVSDSDRITECEYCGTSQTVPQINDEKKAGLFNRANELRFGCDFDAAATIYNSIVSEFPGEAEGYWGLVLCKYGIEYVDDPLTKRKIPTCHRTAFEPIFTDTDYIKTIETADITQRSVYEQQAAEIDGIQKGILDIVRTEKPFDVFICYKEKDNGQRTYDSIIANDIYHQLTQDGLRVFYAAITLEDKLGKAYEPYIFAALQSAKVMLVIGTKPEYFNAVWVKNEWSRFLKLAKTDPGKSLFPCYRDMDPYHLPPEFAYLQAQDMSKIGFITDLIRGIRKLIPKQAEKAEAPASVPAPAAAFEAKESEKKPQAATQIIIDNKKLDGDMQGAFYEGELFAGTIPHGRGKCIYKNGDVYEGEFSQGKRCGTGVMKYESGKTYEGEWKNGLREGRGTFYYYNGDRFDGQWKDDKRNGEGVYVNKIDGSTWHGSWEDDKWYSGEGTMYFFKDGKTATGGKYVGQREGGFFHGSGTYYYPHIEEGTGKWLFDISWTGSWEKGMRVDGCGIIIFNDGSRYDGELKNGTYNGRGTYTWVSGDVYEGEWKDGKRCGQGILKKGGVTVYEGMWQSDSMSGYGKTTDNDGGVYEGEFANNKKTGKGKKLYKNGSSYQGSWLEDRFHGEGTFTYPDGTNWSGTYSKGVMMTGTGTVKNVTHNNRKATYTGDYKDGYLCGRGKLVYEDGEIYEGEFRENKRWGEGAITYPNGKSWRGTFFNDSAQNGQGTLKIIDDWYEGTLDKFAPNGIGKYTYRNGDVYEGNLKGGLRHGKGTMTYRDGSSWSGLFTGGQKTVGISKKKK